MSLIKRERRSAWPQETLWGQDLDGLFRDMVRNVFAGENMFDRLIEGGTHVMRVEEYVEDGSCVVRAELPGIDPEKDVDIQLADGVLSLQAERQGRSDEERPDGFHSEFHYGVLARRIRLPEGTTPEDVKASYHDGILEIRVPAPETVLATPATKIPVSRG